MNKIPSFYQEILDQWNNEQGEDFKNDVTVQSALIDFIMWREKQVISVTKIRRESFL